MYTKTLKVNANLSGRDLFVGDLHGCYSLLMSKLNEIDFDKTKDRLFCTGDLMDRGDENVQSIELLNEDWFESALGNHCFSFIEHVLGGVELYKPKENGMLWIDDLTRDEKERLALTLSDKSHFGIEITDLERNRKYGVFHSTVPSSKSSGGHPDWNLVTSGDIHPMFFSEILSHRGDYEKPILGVDLVFHGHTVTYTMVENFDEGTGACLVRPVFRNNAAYIDMGLCFTKKVNVFELDYKHMKLSML